jgi:hypothetical protein
MVHGGFEETALRMRLLRRLDMSITKKQRHEELIKFQHCIWWAMIWVRKRIG